MWAIPMAAQQEERTEVATLHNVGVKTSFRGVPASQVSLRILSLT